MRISYTFVCGECRHEWRIKSVDLNHRARQRCDHCGSLWISPKTDIGKLELEGGDPVFRRSLAERVLRASDDDIGDLLDHPHSSVREQCARALGDRVQLTSKCVDLLVDLIRKANELPSVRIAAIEALQSTRTTTPVALRALHIAAGSRDQRERQVASEALHRLLGSNVRLPRTRDSESSTE